MSKGKSNDFDLVARIYDKLSEMIFGNTLLDAQKFFLTRIAGKKNVLIIGGGTGELLGEIFRINPTCQVCYIDASKNMITIAREKVSDNRQVKFIHGTERDIPTDQMFDAIITNFYFDLFTEGSLPAIIEIIKPHLKPTGLWLATDFVKTGRLADRILLQTMYFFFTVMSNIEAKDLPDWQARLQTHFSERESVSFRKGFVKSVVFSRG